VETGGRLPEAVSGLLHEYESSGDRPRSIDSHEVVKFLLSILIKFLSC
jgi:hypothetical protein